MAGAELPPESPDPRALHNPLRWVWRAIIFIVGSTVVLIGISLIVLPGPAFIVIPAGLAILGIEFAFARRWLRRVRARLDQAFDQMRGSGGR
jgi:tellurite resistance protein TerC